MRVSATLAGLFVTLAVTGAAHAYPIENGVRWNFEATAHIAGNFTTCCTPLWHEGEQVTGYFQYLKPLGPTRPEFIYTATVLTADGEVFGIEHVSILDISDANHLFGVVPGLAIYNIPSGQFDLIPIPGSPPLS